MVFRRSNSQDTEIFSRFKTNNFFIRQRVISRIVELVNPGLLEELYPRFFFGVMNDSQEDVSYDGCTFVCRYVEKDIVHALFV